MEDSSDTRARLDEEGRRTAHEQGRLRYCVRGQLLHWEVWETDDLEHYIRIPETWSMETTAQNAADRFTKTFRHLWPRRTY